MLSLRHLRGSEVGLALPAQSGMGLKSSVVIGYAVISTKVAIALSVECEPPPGK
jgi:hypothetical protein